MRQGCVGVWKDSWLGISETFIESQVDSYRRWSACRIGLTHQTHGLVAREQVSLGTSNRILSKAIAKGWIADRRVRSWRRELDIVHAHFGPDGASVLTSAQRARVPLIVTFHGYDATLYDASLPTAYLRRRPELFQYMTHAVAVSEYIASRLVEQGMPESKIRVLPIGTTIPVLPGPLAVDPIVSFVGRIVEKKGLADLLEACSLFPGHQRPKVVVVGEGPLRSSMEKYARALNVDVTFLGGMRQAAVHEVIASSRVLCVPSRRATNGDAEGFGMVFIEASARGVPTVSYRTGGVPEAVADGVSGLLAEEGDVAELYSCLHRVLFSPGLAETLGRQGRERVQTHFDVISCTRALEDLYDEIAFPSPLGR